MKIAHSPSTKFQLILSFSLWPQHADLSVKMAHRLWGCTSLDPFLKRKEKIGQHHFHLTFCPCPIFFLSFFPPSGNGASSFLANAFKAVNFASKHDFKCNLSVLTCYTLITVLLKIFSSFLCDCFYHPQVI